MEVDGEIEKRKKVGQNYCERDIKKETKRDETAVESNSVVSVSSSFYYVVDNPPYRKRWRLVHLPIIPCPRKS